MYAFRSYTYKIGALTLAGVMSLSLVACSDDETDTDQAQGTNQATTSAESNVATLTTTLPPEGRYDGGGKEMVYTKDADGTIEVIGYEPLPDPRIDGVPEEYHKVVIDAEEDIKNSNISRRGLEDKLSYGYIDLDHSQRYDQHHIDYASDLMAQRHDFKEEALDQALSLSGRTFSDVQMKSFLEGDGFIQEEVNYAMSSLEEAASWQERANTRAVQLYESGEATSRQRIIDALVIKHQVPLPRAEQAADYAIG